MLPSQTQRTHLPVAAQQPNFLKWKLVIYQLYLNFFFKGNQIILLISVKSLPFNGIEFKLLLGDDKITYALAPVFLSRLRSYRCGPLQATVDFLCPRVTHFLPNFEPVYRLVLLNVTWQLGPLITQITPQSHSPSCLPC